MEFGKVYRDGKLLDIQLPKEVRSIEQITALKVDNAIYFGGVWYLAN